MKYRIYLLRKIYDLNAQQPKYHSRCSNYIIKIITSPSLMTFPGLYSVKGTHL
jgi:hypothetical protein